MPGTALKHCQNRMRCVGRRYFTVVSSNSRKRAEHNPAVLAMRGRAPPVRRPFCRLIWELIKQCIPFILNFAAQPRSRSFRHVIKALLDLASADAQPWWIVVAPPERLAADLTPQDLLLIRMEPGQGLKLHRGTWHAGPFFEQASALFFNLELADTNINDHGLQSLSVQVPLQLN